MGHRVVHGHKPVILARGWVTVASAAEHSPNSSYRVDGGGPKAHQPEPAYQIQRVCRNTRAVPSGLS